MESLVVEIRNPETVQALVEAAKQHGIPLEAYALELLENALLAIKPFEDICRAHCAKFR